MPTPRKRAISARSAVLVTIALTATLTTAPGLGAQQTDTVDPVESGEEAIDALGPDLADVAEGVGLSAAELEAVLEADETLNVDINGELLYIDPPPPFEPEPPTDPGSSGDEPSGPEAAPPTTDPAFTRHSRSGAEHTIYLDFDGNVTSGTSWNAAYGIDPIVSPPYDLDGDPDSWSATELARIDAAWNLVAEDFSPFDVDVTTEDPGVEALRYTGGSDTRWGARVLVTSDTFAGCGCGGFAYIGSFDDSTDEPVFVFNSSLAGVAEAASHEVGHSMWLAHDGSSTTAYYTGHGSGPTGWAPVMGASYYRQVTQWSAQEYFDANNSNSSANYGNGPDDLAVIADLNNGNGFGFRPDDHGDTAAAATTLPGPNLSVEGVIEETDDIDVFSFTTGAGAVSIDIDPWAGGANLDIHAQLLDSGGVVMADSDEPGALDAGFSETLPAGTYSVTVDGTGVGTPAANPPNGYTEYASLGQYSLTGTIIPPSNEDISGMVIEDGTATPLEGVFVGAVGPFPLEAELAGAAFTASDGTYAIDGLADGDYLLVLLDLSLSHAFEYFDDATDVNDSTLLSVGPASAFTADASLAPKTPPPTGPATLSGTVSETGSGTSITGALVVVVGSSGLAGTALTDASGAYSLDLPPGDYFVEFVDLGSTHAGEWNENRPLSELTSADAVTLGPPGLTVDADLDLQGP